MKVVIAGAGAVGAYIGARMARAGRDVTLFARGAHLGAMQQRGVRVISPQGDFEARPQVSASLEEIGPADAVILGVKAHSLPELAPRLRPLLGPDTAVVSTQNGVPWWFFQAGAAPDGAATRLERVDPAGVVSGAIEFRRVVGSIIYFSAEIAEPGVIRHVEGNRVSLGEPDGARSERCRRIAGELIAAGLRCPITSHLREELWVKALGNVALNPVSVLTRATLAAMLGDGEVRELVRGIMAEAAEVAARLRLELPVSIDQRLAGAAKAGEHKTSMLQDFDSGRPLELEAVVGAVVEIGERMGVAMPRTRTVYALTRLLARRRAAEL